MEDYNVEVTEASIQEFRESYFLENMVKNTTCSKNSAKTTCIDMIITNKPGIFQDAKTYETDLSEFHKLVAGTMKLGYRKRPSRVIKYRDYKDLTNEHFKNSLYEKFTNITELDYTGLEAIVLNLLSSQKPFKKRMVRANRRGFMNNEIHKAIMVKSRLRNKFLKEETGFIREAYNKQRNCCAKLIRESKLKYFCNFNVKNITDNKKFWKTVGQNFSSKNPINKNIPLWEKN